MRPLKISNSSRLSRSPFASTLVKIGAPSSAYATDSSTNCAPISLRWKMTARPVRDVAAEHGLLQQQQARLGAVDLLFQIDYLLLERLHARLKRFIGRLRLARGRRG